MALTTYISKSDVKDTLEEHLYRLRGKPLMSGPRFTHGSRRQVCQVSRLRGQ